jgi:hypothetical protein
LSERTLFGVAQIASGVTGGGLAIHRIRALFGLFAAAAALLVDETTAAFGTLDREPRAFARGSRERAVFLHPGLTGSACRRQRFTHDALAACRARLADPDAGAEHEGQLLGIAGGLLRARAVVHILDALDALPAPHVLVTLSAGRALLVGRQALIGAKAASLELRAPDWAAGTTTGARALAGARALTGSGASVGAPSVARRTARRRTSAVRISAGLRRTASVDRSSTFATGALSSTRSGTARGARRTAACASARFSARRGPARPGHRSTTTGRCSAVRRRNASGSRVVVPVALPATRAERGDHQSATHHARLPVTIPPKSHGSQTSIRSRAMPRPRGAPR